MLLPGLLHKVCAGSYRILHDVLPQFPGGIPRVVADAVIFVRTFFKGLAVSNAVLCRVDLLRFRRQAVQLHSLGAKVIKNCRFHQACMADTRAAAFYQRHYRHHTAAAELRVLFADPLQDLQLLIRPVAVQPDDLPEAHVQQHLRLLADDAFKQNGRPVKAFYSILGEIHARDLLRARKAQLAQGFRGAGCFGADIQRGHYDTTCTFCRFNRHRICIDGIHTHAHVGAVPFHTAYRLVYQAAPVYFLQKFRRDEGFKTNFAHSFTLFP